jgi:hypothetical protein
VLNHQSALRKKSEAMLSNYLKVGIRSIKANKLHSFINILGLSLGIAVVLLIGGYVIGEVNVNKDLKDVERTYVIHSKWTPENSGVFYTTLGPLASTLKEQYPSLVEDSYRYSLASSILSSTLNEKAARSFGWTPASAIGNKISYGEGERLTVIGVIEDFHFGSLFQSIGPISLIHIRDRLSYRYLSLRINAPDKTNTIARLRKKWIEIFPEAPFDYVFMEDQVHQFYAVENRIYKSSKVASLLTIIVTIYQV